MPYIAIKGYPKDEAAKRKIAERVNEAFLELWGCPQEAINISIEEIAPEQWEERIEQGEIPAAADKLLIRSGKKLYPALTIFYLDGCPYCGNAHKALEELKRENSAFAAVEIHWIEENEHPDIAARYDYNAVPTVYRNGEKLYEATIRDSYEVIRDNLRRALEKALS